MSQRDTRSSKYQHLFAEISYAHEMLDSFANDDSIQNRLNPFAYDEELLDLEDQLKIEFWRLVEELTDRQKEVIKMYAAGHTQSEIAKALGVNQSSITKSIWGNVDYHKSRRVYGGSNKKLRKILENDDKIKSILQRMNEIRTEKW